MKILMVCLGNICRSPLAQGILQSKLGPDFEVDSAGTGSWHVGQAPDHRSIEVAKKHGIDIAHYRARKFNPADFDDFDLIYAMDRTNFGDISAIAEKDEHRNKIRLILQDENVPDPYYGDEKDFEEVFQLLDKVTDKIVRELK